MPIAYASLQEGRLAVASWDGRAESVEHIGDSGSSVFRFTTMVGLPRILRLTDADHRSTGEIEGELDFLRHLERSGAPSCRPIPTGDGRLAVPFRAKRGPMTASVLSVAPGVYVDEASPHWGRHFFRAWGSNLACLHRYSRSYEARHGQRWTWDREDLFEQADRLLPRDDGASRDILRDLLRTLRGMPANRENFGMVHADHAPQNFNFAPESCEITAFDFGNCCYGWYLSDVAIALSTVRRKANRDEIRRELLAGYTETESLPPRHDEHIERFIRLRAVYVYLDRLRSFGERPSDAQREVLDSLRARVHAKAGW